MCYPTNYVGCRIGGRGYTSESTNEIDSKSLSDINGKKLS